MLAPDRRHPLVRREEEITEVEARSVGPDGADALPESDIPVHKLLGFGPPALLDRTAETLRAAFPQCAVYKSAPHLLELMDGRVSKSGAVRRLCEKLGVSPQKTVSFGDNYNDIDMLQATGLGIAMGNAPEAVKKAAGAVTADNDHEGLLKALNQLDFS